MKRTIKYSLISSTIISIILCIIYLSPLGFEYIIGFKREQPNWNNYTSNLFSFVMTIAVALIVYFIVDKKTSNKINKIKKIEEDIQKDVNDIGTVVSKLENDVNEMDSSVQKISEIQDKIAFETEKSRLMNFFSYSLSEEKKQFFRGNIKTIFHERIYRFRADKIGNSLGYSFTVKFIKESVKQYAIPKRCYPFLRDGRFPYFCVQVIKKDQNPQVNQNRIELHKYYYLSYICFPDSAKQTGWYMAEEYPVENSQTGFKVVFSGTSYSGGGLPLASVSCKDC